MPKPYVYSLLLAAAAASPAAAQQTVPPLKVQYLDSTSTVLPSPAGARFRRETEYADSVGGERREYYLSGQLRSREHFEHFRKHVADGTSETWYPSGQLQWHEEYAHGKLQGERRYYYPGGQLKRRETYAAGERTAGECFAADGQPVAFFEYEVMPVYPEGDGGSRAIVAAVARQVRYPADALRANAMGRVYVSFVVNQAGDVQDIKVVQGVHPSLDRAAVQAVGQLRRFTPGRQDGQIVKVSYTVPITFRIDAPRSLFGKRTTYELPPARP